MQDAIVCSRCSVDYRNALDFGIGSVQRNLIAICLWVMISCWFQLDNHWETYSYLYSWKLIIDALNSQSPKPTPSSILIDASFWLTAFSRKMRQELRPIHSLIDSYWHRRKAVEYQNNKPQPSKTVYYWRDHSDPRGWSNHQRFVVEEATVDLTTAAHTQNTEHYEIATHCCNGAYPPRNLSRFWWEVPIPCQDVKRREQCPCEIEC